MPMRHTGLRSLGLALALSGAAAVVPAGLAQAEAPERATAQVAEVVEPSTPKLVESRGLSAAQLGALAKALSSPEASTRRASYASLLALSPESLPAIGARLGALAEQRPDKERVLAVMTALRHAVGSKRADDVIDRAQGVLSVLEKERDAATLAVIEPLLYLRALERMGGLDAQRMMGDVLALDSGDAWDHEARLLRDRAGISLLPGLVALRSHADSRVRRWAQGGVQALKMEDPREATALESGHLVAELVRAYSEPLDYEAMPVLVRLTANEKLEVRRAARVAVARFGRNAIWQLRELYEEVAGQRANPGWDTERMTRELYTVLDRAAIEESDTLLAQGRTHEQAGELDAMRKTYDRLLALFPFFEPRDQLAPGYAAVGEQLIAQDKLGEARDAFARALRLAPKAEGATQWQAQLAYLDAELALTRGVVDLQGYEKALALDPDHKAAARALDRLSGAHAARIRLRKRMAAGIAFGLLIALAWLLVREGKKPAPSPSRQAS